MLGFTLLTLLLSVFLAPFQEPEKVSNGITLIVFFYSLITLFSALIYVNRRLKKTTAYVNLIDTEKKLDELKTQNEELLLEQELIHDKEVDLKKREKELESERTKLDLIIAQKTSEIELKLHKEYQNKAGAFVSETKERMSEQLRREKEIIVDNIFSFDSSEKDDFFEMKKARESIEKEKEEIQKSQFLLDVDQKVSKANEHVLAAKHSALEIKSENVDIRSEMKNMAFEFKSDLQKEKFEREKSDYTLLHQLELEQERRQSDYRAIGDRLAVMDAQTQAKFTELSSSIFTNLKDLEFKTISGFREVRENISDMKLQFGQEVLRLDSQQGQILNELEKFYVKNQQYVNQCQSLAIEARRQNVDGQQLLNKVNNLHIQHKQESREIERKLRSTMDQVAVKEGELANSVGASMLKIKSFSDDQFIALKDLALQRKGIEVLWQEKNSEHKMNLQELRHQKGDMDRMQQLYSQELSHRKTDMDRTQQMYSQELDHKKRDINMTRQLFAQERSSFEQHKNDALENARLNHRMFMNKQEHFIALQKAQNSGGWLTRWARNIENM